VKIGITGTSEGATRAQAWTLRAVFAGLHRAGAVELHHGDCVGVDAAADAMAQELGWRVIQHPPQDLRRRAFCPGAAEVRYPRPFLDRNTDIVRESDLLVAVPEQAMEVLRSGTWSTVRRGRALRRPCWIVRPDGTVIMDGTWTPISRIR